MSARDPTLLDGEPFFEKKEEVDEEEIKSSKMKNLSASRKSFQQPLDDDFFYEQPNQFEVAFFDSEKKSNSSESAEADNLEETQFNTYNKRKSVEVVVENLSPQD